MKTTKTIRFFYPKWEERHAYFQIQIMKQNKQEQAHDACEIIIQWDFIAKKKFKKNKVMTRNIPKIGVEEIKCNGELYLYLYPLNT
jgi:hypothetical protein